MVSTGIFFFFLTVLGVPIKDSICFSITNVMSFSSRLLIVRNFGKISVSTLVSRSVSKSL